MELSNWNSGTGHFVYSDAYADFSHPVVPSHADPHDHTTLLPQQSTSDTISPHQELHEDTFLPKGQLHTNLRSNQQLPARITPTEQPQSNESSFESGSATPFPDPLCGQTVDFVGETSLNTLMSSGNEHVEPSYNQTALYGHRTVVGSYGQEFPLNMFSAIPEESGIINETDQFQGGQEPGVSGDLLMISGEHASSTGGPEYAELVGQSLCQPGLLSSPSNTAAQGWRTESPASDSHAIMESSQQQQQLQQLLRLSHLSVDPTYMPWASVDNPSTDHGTLGMPLMGSSVNQTNIGPSHCRQGWMSSQSGNVTGVLQTLELDTHATDSTDHRRLGMQTMAPRRDTAQPLFNPGSLSRPCRATAPRSGVQRTRPSYAHTSQFQQQGWRIQGERRQQLKCSDQRGQERRSKQPQSDGLSFMASSRRVMSSGEGYDRSNTETDHPPVMSMSSSNIDLEESETQIVRQYFDNICHEQQSPSSPWMGYDPSTGMGSAEPNSSHKESYIMAAQHNPQDTISIFGRSIMSDYYASMSPVSMLPPQAGASTFGPTMGEQIRTLTSVPSTASESYGSTSPVVRTETRELRIKHLVEKVANCNRKQSPSFGNYISVPSICISDKDCPFKQPTFAYMGRKGAGYIADEKEREETLKLLKTLNGNTCVDAVKIYMKWTNLIYGAFCSSCYSKILPDVEASSRKALKDAMSIICTHLIVDFVDGNEEKEKESNLSVHLRTGVTLGEKFSVARCYPAHDRKGK